MSQSFIYFNEMNAMQMIDMVLVFGDLSPHPVHKCANKWL